MSNDDDFKPLEWTAYRAEAVPRALFAWDMYATGLGHYVVDDAERIKIRAALAAAQVPERDLDWMTQSCPSLLTAIRMYPPKEGQ